MAVTLEQIIDQISDDVRDSTNPTFTNLKKIRAINRILDRLSLKADWKFSKKSKEFIHIEDGEYTGVSIENNLSITDYHSADDVRLLTDHRREFDFIKPDRFAVLAGSGRLGANSYTVETLNDSNILKVAQSTSNKLVIDSMDTFNPTSGTWAADGTAASNIGTDSDVKRVGSGSVKFDLASAQTSGYIEKTFSTTSDFTSYLGLSSFRFFIYIPTGLTLSSITLRWGSSDSAYWSKQVTSRYDGSSFQTGWNRIDIPWENDATESGTPLKSAVDYYRIVLGYTASSDVSDIRIDDFTLIRGTEMIFTYFTNKFVKTSSTDTTWQRLFSTSTIDLNELLLAPDDFVYTLIEGANWRMLAQAKSASNREVIARRDMYLESLRDLIYNHGVKPKREGQTLQLKSYWGSRYG